MDGLLPENQATYKEAGQEKVMMVVYCAVVSLFFLLLFVEVPLVNAFVVLLSFLIFDKLVRDATRNRLLFLRRVLQVTCVLFLTIVAADLWLPVHTTSLFLGLMFVVQYYRVNSLVLDE